LIVVTSPEPEGVVTTSRMSDGKGLLDLESPKRAAEKTGLFTIFPSLSYDDYDSSEDEEVVDRAMTSEEVTFSIKEFRTRFAKLKQKWTSVFQDIEASHLMVTTDLDKYLLPLQFWPPRWDHHQIQPPWTSLLQAFGRL